MTKDVQKYETVRERICANEDKLLSPYAVRSSQTKGRLREDPACDFRRGNILSRLCKL